MVNDRDSKIKEVENILRNRLPQDGPGVAVLVMVGDDTVLLEGYGNARIGQPNRKITKDSVFDLASLSKQFTALGILMLIDGTTISGPRGGRYKSLDFGTKLSRYFKDVPRAKDISIRNLLNHSSGIADYFSLWKESRDLSDQYYDDEIIAPGNWFAEMKGYEKVEKKDDYITNEGVLRLIAKKNIIESEPREGFSYSNTGYVLLAEIIRRHTCKRLRDFLREEIFEPLEMSDTFVYDETVPGFTDHALCYLIRENDGNATYESIEGDTHFSYIHGDGNIHSTIADLAKWQKAWNQIDDITIRDGGRRLINRSTFLKIYKPGLFRKQYWVGSRKYKYSSGMSIYRYKNRNVNSYAIHHGGNWLGFNSYLMRGHVYKYRKDILHELTVVVLSNFFCEAWNQTDPFKDDRFPYKIGKDISTVFWPWKGKDRYNILQYI
jgi:CubicO group peptidase (beta-lactamase class C family)